MKQNIEEGGINNVKNANGSKEFNPKLYVTYIIYIICNSTENIC